MPPKFKAKFNANWLSMPEFAAWLAEGKDVHSAACKICQQSFTIAGMGITAVKSHSSSSKHSSAVARSKQQLSLSQFMDKPPSSSVMPESQPSTSTFTPTCSTPVIVDSTKPFYKVACDFVDNTTKSEALWSLNVVMKHLSYRSCDGVADIFKQMFPDSVIANKFSLGRDKVRYTILYGLAPFFHQELLSVLTVNGTEFALSFDESLNKVLQEGQMDLHIRFWDQAKEMAITRYWGSVCLGKASANDLLEAFHDGIEPLSMESIFQVSMDGPSVNWSFYAKLKSELSTDAPSFLDCGSCGLHIMHGAFQTGHQASGWKLNELLVSLYYHFKDSPSKRVDFRRICGADTPFPLKFCKCRWLENTTVAKRTIQIWKHIEQYVSFFSSAEGKASKLEKPNTASFARIESACGDPLILAKLSFFKAISDDVYPFLVIYQTESPMLPFFCEDWKKTLLLILKRFICGGDISGLSTEKLSAVDVFDEKTLIQLKDIDIGFAARDVVHSAKVSDLKKMQFRSECRLFLQKMASKMLERSPLRFTVVRNAGSLSPETMCATPASTKQFKNLLTAFYRAKRMSSEFCERASQEYETFCFCMRRDHLTEFLSFDLKKDRLDVFMTPYLEKGEYSNLFKVFRMVSIVFQIN